MQVKVTDGKFGVNVELVPDTVEDTNLLLRMALNANSEKPTVNYYIPEGKEKSPYCRIWLSKRNPKVQKHCINNRK